MIHPIREFIAWRRRRTLEATLGSPVLATDWEELWIPTGGDGRVYAHLHAPRGGGTYPGVVMVPGGASPGTDYDRGRFVRAEELASLGFRVLHYDPSGRGRSGGREDHWGTAHQRELTQVLGYLGGVVGEAGLAIFSISIGITIASGALARVPDPRVKLLFDWEGPSSRRITTRNDTHKPLAAFPSGDDVFWREREAVTFIPRVRCGYYRYQAEVDHVQDRFKGHAVELVNAAVGGDAVWVRCNDNPVGQRLDEERLGEYRWAQGGFDDVLAAFGRAWGMAVGREVED